MDREELKGYILEKMAGSYDLYNTNMASSDGKTRYDAEITKGQAKHKRIQTADAYMDSQYGYQSKPKANRIEKLQVEKDAVKYNKSKNGRAAYQRLKYQEMGTRPHEFGAGEIKSKTRINAIVDPPRRPIVNRTESIADSRKNIAKNNPLGVVGANNRINNSLDGVKGTKMTPFVNTPEATGSKIGPLKENVPKKSVNGKILSTGSGLNKNPKLTRSYKTYHFPEVGRSNNLKEGAKKVVNDKATQSTAKDSVKNGASAAKDAVKSGASSAATAVKNGGNKLLSGAKKGGKLALIGTGIGLGIAGSKALLGGNQQPPQDNQRLATFTVVEDGIEKQAIAFSGIERRDIPKTKRRDKKRAKKFYKSLPTEKKREFLNKSYKEKAKLYNKTDASKDSLGNFALATVPSVAGTVAALKGHPRAGMALNVAMIPGFAGQVASNMKNNRADAYAKKKTMDEMLGIKDKKANTFNNDMEKQAIAFSGKKIKDIPKTSRRDKKEVKEYYESLSPEDKHKFDIGADIGSLKYYDAYDRRRDGLGNTITTATLIGAPLGWPGAVATDIKENRATARGKYDQMQKMKKRHKKEALEVLDNLYKEASIQGVSGLANATNAVSPFAKATLKDVSSTPLPSLNTDTDATNITPPPKPPKTDATEVKNDVSTTSKEANEIINSFAEVLEKTASDFLGLSEEELQPKDSEYMANKRLYIDLFNSPNINW